MPSRVTKQPGDQTQPRKAKKTDLREAVDKAITAIAEKLGTNEVKGTVGDLIRLLQLREELGPAKPREVTAKWVDQCETTATEE